MVSVFVRSIGAVVAWIFVIALLTQGCAAHRPAIEPEAQCGQSDLPVEEWER